MNIMRYLINPHNRIIATHFIVILILLTNILFFTLHPISLALQAILILAVLLHNKDDILLNNELTNIEQRLREDRNIFDRNIIVSESDLNGNITYANPKFVEISGYSLEELIGNPHSILRDPDTPKEVFLTLWSTITKGKTFHGTLKNIRKNGTKRDYIGIG